MSPPKIDPESRPAAPEAASSGGRSSVGTWLVRTVLVVLFGVCSAVAAAAWQTYGDQAQELVAHWMPRISLMSNADRDGSAPAAAPLSHETTTATASVAPQAQEPAANAAAATVTSEQVQMLQSMARDIAALSQQVNELKAGIAQLKAGQDQVARDVARAAEAKPTERTAEARAFDPRAIEQTLRPRPAPRPATAAVAPPPGAAAVPHRPRPATAAVPPPPAPMALQSAPPPQGTTDPDQPVVRPPMPVR